MARLSPEEFLKKIKEPVNSGLISNAVVYENKIRMHSVAYTEEPNNPAYHEWLNSMACMLHPTKFELFKSSIKYPLKSVPVYQSIYSKLSKIFDANDANKDVFFSENHNDEKELFKEDLKNLSTFWETKGYKELQTNPCSFVVIDFPEEKQKAEPLHFFVPINSVVDCVLKDDNVTPEYFIYKVDEKKIIAIDDEFRRVFLQDENSSVWFQDLEIGDMPVFTDTIPVRSFITTVIDENPFKKGVKSIAATLGLSEWFLYIAISEDIPSLYALFPDKWIYGETADFTLNGDPQTYNFEKEDENGKGIGRCVNDMGRTYDEQENHVSINRGFGNVHVKPYPTKDGIENVGEPFGYLEAPVETLQQIEKEVNRRGDLIISIATGQTNGEVQDKQALNESQVAALNQGQQTVLQRLANDFSLIEKWVTDTEGAIRFGDAYDGSIVNYGTTFITLTPNAIEENIKAAKDSGANESQLKVLYFMWYDSKFKTEPLQAEKYKILFDVEPFPTHSIAEMQDNRDVIDPIQWTIKLNFNSFISRFENEDVLISSFSKELTNDQKVQSINARLQVYANELLIKQPKEDVNKD